MNSKKDEVKKAITKQDMIIYLADEKNISASFLFATSDQQLKEL